MGRRSVLMVLLLFIAVFGAGAHAESNDAAVKGSDPWWDNYWKHWNENDNKIWSNKQWDDYWTNFDQTKNKIWNKTQWDSYWSEHGSTKWIDFK